MVHELCMESNTLSVFAELVRENERCRSAYEHNRGAYYRMAVGMREDYVNRIEPLLASYRARVPAINEQMTLRENIFSSANRQARRRKEHDISTEIDS